MRGMDISQLVAHFTERLHAAVDQISVARARDAVMHALGEKRGRLPKGMAAILGRKPRRKGPLQLCPVPGCKNAAAPVFGMVCAEHKNVGKTKIKQYREARRAAKKGADKGAKKAAKKVARLGAGDGAGRGAKRRPKPAKQVKAAKRARPPRSARAAKPARSPAADKATTPARTRSAGSDRVQPSSPPPRPPATTVSDAAGATP